MLRKITSIDFQSNNNTSQCVLIRVDFNVPVENDLVSDDYRILKSLPTIQYCLDQGAKVVLMSHRGRPKGKADYSLSLMPAGEKLAQLLEMPIKFSHDCISENAIDVSRNLKSGEIHLLENLRFHKEEKAGDDEFAKELSKLGDIYVNDAFGTAHRAHASTAVLAKYFPKNKCYGLLLASEIKNIHKVLTDSEKPVTAIIGGAKVSSKITIIESILDKIDHLIIGGGMTFTFIKALGGNIGNSLVEDDKLKLAREILEKAKQQNKLRDDNFEGFSMK